MKNIILQAIEKYSDTELNIASEVARDMLAEDIRVALVMNGYADQSRERKKITRDSPIRNKNGQIISNGMGTE